MVYKKYIKRNGRIFGPYLYENYRENGVVKTRYLGLGKEKARVDFKLLSAIIIVFLAFLLIGLFFYDYFKSVEDEEEGLFSIFDFFRASVRSFE